MVRKIIFTCIILSGLFYSIPANCQYTLSGSYTFGTWITDPIEMDVKRANDKISFNATNRSLFDYTLIINFTNLQNVFPMVFMREIKLHPGYNNLFDLTIKNSNQGVSYEYSIRYSMRLAKNPDLTFPYLVPVAKGRIVYLITAIDGNEKKLVVNQFKTQEGDTIFAMRRGLVTALPEDNGKVDRIFKSGSLEVLQPDGTLAIYRGIKVTPAVRLGHQVFAGQPIGLANNKGFLTITVLTSIENLKFKEVPVMYSTEPGKIISQESIDGVKVLFPEDVLKKELAQKELKKFEKGKLY